MCICNPHLSTDICDNITIDINNDDIFVDVVRPIGSEGRRPLDTPTQALAGSGSSYQLQDGTTKATYLAIIHSEDVATIAEVEMRLVNVEKVRVMVFETEEETVPVEEKVHALTKTLINEYLYSLIMFL